MIKAYSNYAVSYDDQGWGFPVDLIFDSENEEDYFHLRTTHFIDEFFFLGNNHVRHIVHGGNYYEYGKYEEQVYQMVYEPTLKVMQ